jgi:type II secretory pathway component PulF
MRLALSIVGSDTAKPNVQRLARQIAGDIVGGSNLQRVFSRHLSARQQYIASLVAAGEAAGDLAGSLERAAEMLEARLAAQGELISVLAYPVFVLFSAIVALAIIVLLVVPSLAPLAEAPGAHPGAVMRGLLALSAFLRTNVTLIASVSAGMGAIGLVGALLGIWGPIFDRALLHGPFGNIAGALVYGAFAVSLGGLIAAGAPISEAMRLAVASVRSPTAKKELESLSKTVRQGEKLSKALRDVRGFPPSIVRLAIVGEQSATLGQMLQRAGRFEERTAMRKIGVSVRILGPALIVGLGALVGLLMTGLLTGISDLGESALQ